MSNFYSATIAKDPRFTSYKTTSDIDLLEPVTREKVLAIIEAAKTKKVDLMVFETFRSQIRQEQLFARGASKLRTVGVHHFGLGCAIVRKVDGKPSWKGDFAILGELAREHGMIWGGDWGKPGTPHDFIDSVYLQRCSLSRQESLFALDWYPDANYDPYADKLS